MSTAGRFRADSATFHRGRRCERCAQFYTDAEGEVHPIRSSPGYDPSVEDVQREHRERSRLERTYGHERAERHAQVVARPPWAAGISDASLLKIAKAHGQHASQPGWWEAAHLHGNSRYTVGGGIQRTTKISGELRRELSEGANRGDRRRAGARRAEKAPTRTRLMPSQARQAAGDFSDLPW